MNEIYFIEFSYYYQIFNNLKIKECELLRHIIEGSRIGQYMNFNNYANISFDDEDKLSRFAKIELLENFDRKKTNCMVFNLAKSQLNNDRYNKLFLYMHSTRSDTYYGFILYNTATDKCTQIADVSGEPNDIVQRINRCICDFNACDKLEKQLAEKRKNGF